MKISQREARRLQKRVTELEGILERQRNAYATEWPRGIHLGRVSWSADEHLASAVSTARKLGHAVVANADGSRAFNLYAIKLP